jgi:PAS domain S-box-containing protein
VESCDLDPALKQTVRAERIGALAFLPLVVQGELIGQFMAYHDAPHDFGAAELDLASIIARQIGFGIARMQAESSRQRLAAIVEASEDAIVSKSLDGIVESWNRGAERLFGYVAHEVIGKPITIIIPPERRGEEPSILDCVRLGRRVEPYETLRRRKDGSLVDVSLTVSPVKDASGRIVGASKIARDISERKRTEALMASQRQALEMAASRTPLMEVLDFLARAAESHSRQASRVAIHLLDPTGQSFERTAAPSLPSGYASAVDGMGIASAAVPCCIAASSRKRVVVSDVAASNEFPTFAEFALPLGIRSGWSIPILSSLGQVLGTVAHYYGHVRAADSRDDMLGDIIARTAGIIIERTQAEEAIARSEERFRSLVSVITDVPWSADADGAFVVPQPAWSRYTGQSWDEHRQFGWTNAFHPDDRAGVLQKWEAARVARSLYESCGRLWHAASQSYRWFEARATPLLSADGCVREWVGTCTDVDDRKKAQARQELLTEEIQHRTKNLFAVVQAVISRSFVGKKTVEEAERAVLSRLHSLGQTHVLLMDGEWQGADIAEIVATEMSPYLGRVVTQGPSVNLNAKSAQTFSLALHELATNSAKYGALSSTVGVVDINWSIVNTNGSGIFTFQWQERGGPLVAPPTRKGFGRTVLEQVMAELFEPCITFAPGGVRYELSAPLDNIIASLRDGNERPVGDTVKAEQVGGGERDHVISGHGRRAELPEPD